jgi:hypothetical protein
VLLEYERRNESEHGGFVAAIAQKPGRKPFIFQSVPIACYPITPLALELKSLCIHCNCFLAACKCSNFTLTESSGGFASPGYPETFCPHMLCFARVEVAEGSSILLSFDELDLPDSGRLSVAGDKENFTRPLVFL